MNSLEGGYHKKYKDYRDWLDLDDGISELLRGPTSGGSQMDYALYNYAADVLDKACED